MSDTKGKIKDGINEAAHAAKKATDTVAEKAGDAAHATKNAVGSAVHKAGDAVERAGEKVKKMGK